MVSGTVVLIFALLASPLEAQQTPAANAAAATLLRWERGAPYADEILVQGAIARLVVADSVGVLAVIRGNESPMPIEVQIVNLSERRFNLYPDSFTLEAVEPIRKPLKYVSPAKIAKKIQNRAAWAMIAEGLAGFTRGRSGTSRQTTTGSAYSSDGTRVYGSSETTTYDHTQNQLVTSQNLMAIQGSAEDQKLRRLTGVLLATTLFPGQGAGGIVYFEREKKARTLRLRLPIDRFLVEIPLPVPGAAALEAVTPERRSPLMNETDSAGAGYAAAAVEYPWIGSFEDGVYFRATCTAAQQVPTSSRRYFAAESIAVSGRYRRSSAPGC